MKNPKGESLKTILVSMTHSLFFLPQIKKRDRKESDWVIDTSKLFLRTDHTELKNSNGMTNAETKLSDAKKSVFYKGMRIVICGGKIERPY